MPKLIRITTAPISLNVLLRGQMKYMREQGFDVIMVSSDGKELQTVIENEQCRHRIVPMTRRMTPFADLRCLWLLYRFFKKEKPDIVHSHTPKAGLLSMMAAKFAGVKIRIHTVAGLRFATSKGFSRRLLVSMEKLTGRTATHVWPNSYSLERYIREHKLVKTSKLEVIGKGSSNGVNLSRYSKAAIDEKKIAEIKNAMAYRQELLYFLSVGRIVHDKGMDELLNALLKIYETNPNVRLLLVGAFEDEVDPVSEKTRQLIMSHPAVIMAGWSEEVEYYMHLSYALVHPSHREGFPNVLLQAGAMCCPVICSRIEGNIDLIENGKTGLIFTVKNEDELYSAMQYALTNPDQLQQFSRALRQHIEQNFSQSVIHSLLYKRYLELLEKEPSQG